MLQRQGFFIKTGISHEGSCRCDAQCVPAFRGEGATVQPHFTDTHSIGTHSYYRQFVLSQRKDHILPVQYLCTAYGILICHDQCKAKLDIAIVCTFETREHIL